MKKNHAVKILSAVCNIYIFCNKHLKGIWVNVDILPITFNMQVKNELGISDFFVSLRNKELVLW